MLINARKTDPAWLTTHVKKLILKKKRLYDKYKKSYNINNFETYKQFKNLVTREIPKSKKDVLNKLTENLANRNSKQNSWWKTLKDIIKPDHVDVMFSLLIGSWLSTVHCFSMRAYNIILVGTSHVHGGHIDIQMYMFSVGLDSVFGSVC